MQKLSIITKDLKLNRVSEESFVGNCFEQEEGDPSHTLLNFTEWNSNRLFSIKVHRFLWKDFPMCQKQLRRKLCTPEDKAQPFVETFLKSQTQNCTLLKSVLIFVHQCVGNILVLQHFALLSFCQHQECINEGLLLTLDVSAEWRRLHCVLEMQTSGELFKLFSSRNELIDDWAECPTYWI